MEKQTITSLVPVKAEILHKTSEQLAIRRGIETRADYVPHLDFEQVKRLCRVVKERDALIIKTLFDGCLRVSEGLSIRPRDIVKADGGWIVHVLGKGKKRSAVAVSSSIAAELRAYAYDKQIGSDSFIFPITRFRVHQVVKKAMQEIGFAKPDGVGSVHILRHSGAIERLKRTGNPKAVQDQLRHSSALMTLRYMKTLSHQESIKIQQEVDYQW